MESREPDAQRKFERRALGNVRRLFETLDYNDTLDRNSERRFIIVACSGAAIVIAVLGLSALLGSPNIDSQAALRTQCITEKQDDAVFARKKELQEKYPEMRPTELNHLLKRHFNSSEPAARARCELIYPKIS